MKNQNHEVQLSPQERKKLKAVVSKGRNKAAVIRRAHILLKTDEGKTDTEISQALYVSEQTVRRTRIRYCEEELQNALEDKPVMSSILCKWHLEEMKRPELPERQAEAKLGRKPAAKVIWEIVLRNGWPAG